jgi:hypothetical protein
MRGKSVVATAAIGILALAAADSGQPRATMHRVFEAIRVLLPLSLDSESFRDPKNQAEISARIEVLAGASQTLEGHATSRDRTFQFLSHSLAGDVEEIRHRYRSGRLEEARFYVLEATRNCVACHARLPNDHRFPLASRLLDQIDLQKLSHHERGQLYVATRQFDKALDSWEELFAGQLVSAAQLDVGGYLNDYLTIAIRVQGDYGRARKAIAIVRAREDLPDYLAPKLDLWLADLARFEKAPPDWKTLDAARALAGREMPGEDVEDDALTATITDLVASSLLLRFVDAAHAANERTPELAEAYYWLGKVEARSADSFWVPQAPFHLELSIRLDPRGEHAEEALALYEEQLAFGYGGIESEILPVDLWTTLNELRKLVAEGQS